MPRRRASVCLLLLVAALLGACASAVPRGPADDTKLLEQLGFLQDEQVQRSLVESRLGAAQALFEGGRVAVYRVYERDGRLTQSAARADHCFSLVIEYSEAARVQRRALVRVACQPARGGEAK